MLASARSVHNTNSGRWYLVGVIALVMVTAPGPGQVITLAADCYWSTSKSGPVLHTSTESYLVVRAPAIWDRPLYLTNVRPLPIRHGSGPIATQAATPAVGMLIRTFAWDGGVVRLVNGVLMSDGKVWVNGRALVRADTPQG